MAIFRRRLSPHYTRQSNTITTLFLAIFKEILVKKACFIGLYVLKNA